MTRNEVELELEFISNLQKILKDKLPTPLSCLCGVPLASLCGIPEFPGDCLVWTKDHGWRIAEIPGERLVWIKEKGSIFYVVVQSKSVKKNIPIPKKETVEAEIAEDLKKLETESLGIEEEFPLERFEIQGEPKTTPEVSLTDSPPEFSQPNTEDLGTKIDEDNGVFEGDQRFLPPEIDFSNRLQKEIDENSKRYKELYPRYKYNPRELLPAIKPCPGMKHGPIYDRFGRDLNSAQFGSHPKCSHISRSPDYCSVYDFKDKTSIALTRKNIESSLLEFRHGCLHGSRPQTCAVCRGFPRETPGEERESRKGLEAAPVFRKEFRLNPSIGIWQHLMTPWFPNLCNTCNMVRIREEKLLQWKWDFKNGIWIQLSGEPHTFTGSERFNGDQCTASERERSEEDWQVLVALPYKKFPPEKILTVIQRHPEFAILFSIPKFKEDIQAIQVNFLFPLLHKLSSKHGPGPKEMFETKDIITLLRIRGEMEFDLLEVFIRKHSPSPVRDSIRFASDMREFFPWQTLIPLLKLAGWEESLLEYLTAIYYIRSMLERELKRRASLVDKKTKTYLGYLLYGSEVSVKEMFWMLYNTLKNAPKKYRISRKWLQDLKRFQTMLYERIESKTCFTEVNIYRKHDYEVNDTVIALDEASRAIIQEFKKSLLFDIFKKPLIVPIRPGVAPDEWNALAPVILETLVRASLYWLPYYTGGFKNIHFEVSDRMKSILRGEDDLTEEGAISRDQYPALIDKLIYQKNLVPTPEDDRQIAIEQKVRWTKVIVGVILDEGGSEVHIKRKLKTMGYFIKTNGQDIPGAVKRWGGSADGFRKFKNRILNKVKAKRINPGSIKR